MDIIMFFTLLLISFFMNVSPQSVIKVPPQIKAANWKLNQDQASIDVPTGESLTLICEGDEPIEWTLPEMWPPTANETLEAAIKTEKCHESTSASSRGSRVGSRGGRKCIYEIKIEKVSYEHTAWFVCKYKKASDRDVPAAIYVYVNDEQNLIAPYEGNPEMVVLWLPKEMPGTLPCRPTNSKATMKLLKGGREHPIGEKYGITYEPTRGFTFEHPNWDQFSLTWTCVASLGDHKSTMDIYIDPYSCAKDPYFMIGDKDARHLFVGANITLTCEVSVELGVHPVNVNWMHPVADSSRVKMTEIDSDHTNQLLTSRYLVKRNITIYNLQPRDSGFYNCTMVGPCKNNMFQEGKYIYIEPNSTAKDFIRFESEAIDAIVVDEGTNVTIGITVNSYPDVSKYKIWWSKDGQSVKTLNSERYKDEIQGSDPVRAHLYIPFATLYDSGIYTIHGSLEDEYKNHGNLGDDVAANYSVTVLVEGVPQTLIINTDKYYLVGEAHELSCRVTGYPLPKAMWRFQECPMPNQCNQWQDVDDQVVEPLNGEVVGATKNTAVNEVLLEVKTNATKSGNYRCFGQNQFGTSVAELNYIVTDVKEGFNMQFNPETVIEGANLTVTCAATKFNFSSIEILWKDVNQSSEYEPVMTNNSTLLTRFETDLSINLTYLIMNVTMAHSGDFKCVAKIRNETEESETIIRELDVEPIVPPKMMSTTMREKIEANAETSILMECKMSGRPEPDVIWTKDDTVIDANTSEKKTPYEFEGKWRLRIPRLKVQDSGVYKCYANNHRGAPQLMASAKLFVESNESRIPVDYQLFIGIVVVIVVALLIMAFVLGKKLRAERRHKREMEFIAQNLFDGGQLNMFNPDLPLDEQVELLPYDHRWEFPKERIKLGRVLGQGAFGRVVKAEAIGIDDSEDSTTVAVKMLKERADVNQRKALMAELKILIHLGKHVNIVNLLGAVTKNVAKGELLVIVEYCRYGNLRHYLMAHRNSFVNQIDSKSNRIDPNLTMTEKERQEQDSISRGGSLSQRSYVNVCAPKGMNNPTYTSTPSPSTSSYQNNSVNKLDYVQLDFQHSAEVSCNPEGVSSIPDQNAADFSDNDATGSDGMTPFGPYRGEPVTKKGSKDKPVTTTDLVCYAFQVARGMEYLTERNLIHRDLAARNVLLADDNIVKICDFGLAKDLYNYDNYVKKGDGPLPIKWMAIESISDRVFTAKSDVWSFGILLWELFTLGGNPYPGLEINEEFYNRLKAGYRMEKPDFANQSIYSMMSFCWLHNPDDRPNFGALAETLGQMLEESVRQHYIELNDPYIEMNKINNNDYLNMIKDENSMEQDEDNKDTYLQMTGGSTSGEQTAIEQRNYDNLPPNVRVVNGTPSRLEPMELVPMIDFESNTVSYDHHYQNQPCLPQLTAVHPFNSHDYLSMNSMRVG